MPTLYYQQDEPFSQRVLLAFACAQATCERVALSDAAQLPASYAGKALPLLVVDDEVLDNSLEILDWALAQAPDNTWTDWDLDEMDDSLYLLELCDGPFNDYLQDYLHADSPEQRDTAAQHCVGFLQQLDSLLQDSPCLLGEQPVLVDFAILPLIVQFVNQAPAFWQQHLPAQLQQWLNRLLGDPLCEGILHAAAE